MTDAMLDQVAPKFSLLDQHGNQHSLQDYQGDWCVIYFYPKDDTPGCTKQACNLRNNYSALTEKNIKIIGISVDTQQKHQQFVDKYQLPFPLLSDVKGGIAKQYKCLFSLGPIKFAKRHSFLIDPSGTIRAIFRSVQADQHSQQILASFQRLTLS